MHRNGDFFSILSSLPLGGSSPRDQTPPFRLGFVVSLSLLSKRRGSSLSVYPSTVIERRRLILLSAVCRSPFPYARLKRRRFNFCFKFLILGFFVCCLPYLCFKKRRRLDCTVFSCVSSLRLPRHRLVFCVSASVFSPLPGCQNDAVHCSQGSLVFFPTITGLQFLDFLHSSGK